MGNARFDFGDARFAAIFAPQILENFVKAVNKMGLRLDADKTVILTNEA